MFSSLSPSEIEQLVMAMSEVKLTKGEAVIKQGDKGDNFYIVEKGDFDILVNDVKVASRGAGDYFGELALMYNAPRAATVVAASPSTLWALDRLTFRNMVASNREDQLSEIKKALRAVKILESLTEEQLARIADAVQIIDFKAGDTIIRKGEAGDKASTFYMIKAGQVKCKDIGEGDKRLADIELEAGKFFGERALLLDEPRAANVVALKPTACMTLDRKAFNNLLGPLQELLDQNLSLTVLSSMPMFAKLGAREKEAVVRSFRPLTFGENAMVVGTGKAFEGFVVVKSGAVRVLEGGRSVERLAPGGYFGQEALRGKAVSSRDYQATEANTQVFVLDKAAFEAAVKATLAEVEARAAAPVEAASAGAAAAAAAASSGAGTGAGGHPVPPMQAKMKKADLEVIRTLGAGTFGRVKLVRHKPTNGAYALKVLQKAQIVSYGQQKNVMNERNVMCMVNHPFVLKLCATFRDRDCLYMLLELVQGGELFSLLANQEAGYLQNDDARFYAACVVSGLEALHAKDILYRDLKPENMLLDRDGYIKIVDMGFAKIVHDHTYTLCGTPEYLAPELVYGKGHGKGVDYWAVGVLIYEMLCGTSPFADESNDQMKICKKIVKGRYTFPAWIRDKEAKDIINKLLTQKVTSRLGCKKGGVKEILTHKWFAPIDWDALVAKRIAAPWKPPLKDPFDTSHFDPYDEDDEVERYEDDGSGWDAEF